jgi:hypothetical protein
MKSISIALAFAACGGKPGAQPKPPEPVAQAALPDVPFDKLEPEQKQQFMKEKVVPTMAPLFQAHDAKKYAEFACKTCHGPGATDGHFDMPNAKLPRLVTKELIAGTSKLDKRDIEWMTTQVKPTMAKLLGRAQSTPESTDGFGCHACHPVEW